MTNSEFSDAFTTLVNSYANKIEFGNQNSVRDLTFNEYEKSLFLTEAQNDIVVSLYTGKNAYGQSFETNEELRRSLESLVKDKVYTTEATGTGLPVKVVNDDTAPQTDYLYKQPDDILFIVYEQVKTATNRGCWSKNYIKVYPIRHDEYNVIKENPFRGTSRFKALRLDAGNGYIEIISKFGVSQYLMRYLSKPDPIILENLPDGLTVDNQSTASECQLNELLHQSVLERAVMLALRTRGININTKE